MEFRRRPWLLPLWRDSKWVVAKALLAAGAMFTVLNLMSIVGSYSDGIIIARRMGASAMASYGVTQKLFLGSMVMGFISAPFWPAFGEALARGDAQWVYGTLKRLLKLSVICGAAVGLPLVIFGKWIVHSWAGQAVVPSTGLLIAFALWGAVGAYGGVLTAILNNPRLILRQVGLYSLASLCALGLKFYLVRYYGQAGPVYATVIAYGILFCWPATLLAFRCVSEVSSQRASPFEPEIVNVAVGGV
jgi:O-antigen/teichoic acid export membrane protein